MFLRKNIFNFFLILLFTLPLHAEFRIVSLNPAITELLFELGLGQQIVGTTTFSNFPEKAKNIPIVGSYLSPQIEKIILLKPTHVLAFREGDSSIDEQLKRAQIHILVMNAKKLDDFKIIVQTLSKEFSSTAEIKKASKNILEKWNQQMSELQKIKNDKKIMIQLDENPLFIAGSNTFLSEGLSLCGLKNIYENLSGYKRVQLESVIQKNPDIILYLNMTKSNFEDVQKSWHQTPGLSHAQTLLVDGDSLSRLSSRLPGALLGLCKKISVSQSAP